MKQHVFLLSLLSFSVQQVFAQDSTIDVPTLQFKASAGQLNRALGDVEVKEIPKTASTIGSALSEQVGIHAGQYTGGVSRPVIRGQEGARVKITQNGGDLMDVSAVSPDHTVTVDPQSAQKIQILKGPESLMYGAGSVGGLINVIDDKMPTKLPKHGAEGSFGTAYNSGNDGMLYTGKTSVALGEHFALQAGGTTRRANDYILPSSLQNDEVRRQESTFSKADQYSLGASWIYDRGFTGISYSERHDRYGIPSENELYGTCEPVDGKLVCDDHDHDHDHDHEGASWINLKQKRYEIKSELNDPFVGFSKLTAQAGYTRYQHEEMHGDEAETTFKSRGRDARITLRNEPLAGWKGEIGTQYSQQKLDIAGEEALMAPTKTQRYSVFGVQNKKIDDVDVQVSSRIDHQKIKINSDQKDAKATAYSAALGTSWEFIPHYRFSVNTSHQERLPMAQELYSDGVHMATNTYELGNENLKKEKSNNVELGLHFEQDRLKYNVGLYHNWFNNFIYANTLDRFQDFRLIQYNQASARFYGIDGDVSYQLTPNYTVGVFGDYVRGKIEKDNAPRIPAGRLGVRFNANLDNGVFGNAEYSHVFKQEKIAQYESQTAGYNLLNLGVGYGGQLTQKSDYKAYIKANNVLNSRIYQHESFLADVAQMGRNFAIGFDVKF